LGGRRRGELRQYAGGREEDMPAAGGGHADGGGRRWQIGNLISLSILLIGPWVQWKFFSSP
jgi:hypothetical protein